MPRKSVFKAAERLCVCDKCQLEYGTCKLYKEFTLNINTVWFMKIVHGEQTTKDTITDDYSHYILPGQKFIEGRYLVKVSEQN